MQVDVEKQKNQEQRIADTFKTINFFLKIFSLKFPCIKGTGIDRVGKIIKMVIPFIVLGAANIYTLYYKNCCLNFYIIPSIRYTETLQITFDFFQYALDLYFVYIYGVTICREYISRYCFMDNLITMVYYSDIKRKSRVVLLCFVSLWTLSSICDYIAWIFSNGFTSASVFSIAYFYFFIKVLTNMHLTLHVMHVEFRMRTVGNCVQTLYTSYDSVPEMFQEPLCSTWFNECSRDFLLNPPKKYSSQEQGIEWFNRYYLLLIEQIKFINYMFGMRILLNSLSLFIDMVRFINMTVRIILGSQFTHLKYYTAVSTVFRLLTCASVLISLVYHTDNVYEQRERLLCLIDNLLVNKITGENMVDKLKNFRDLVRARPVSFHMANFIRIDKTFLVATASVVATYSIILLQSVN